MLLIRSPLIGIPGRDGDPYAKVPGLVEERGNVLGGMAVEYRRVDIDRKARRLRLLDGGNGKIVDAGLRN